MMKGKVTVNFKMQPSAKRLFEEAQREGYNSVEVGVFGSEETSKIAAVHEYGTSTVPKRSFLRATMKLNDAEYKRASKDALQEWKSGKITMSTALNRVGTKIVSDIKKRIIRGIAPSLQPRTVASKRARGLPRPHVALYATGALYNSIQARLKKK